MKLDKGVQAEFQSAVKSGDLKKAFSFEEIKDRLRGALNGEIKTPFDCGYFWIRDTFLDKVIIEGNLDGDGDQDLLSVDYSMDASGIVTLGGAQKVKQGEYVPSVDEDNPSTLNGLPLKKRDFPQGAKKETVNEKAKAEKETKDTDKTTRSPNDADTTNKEVKPKDLKKANAYDDYKLHGGSPLDEGAAQDSAFLDPDELDDEIDSELEKGTAKTGKVAKVEPPNMDEKLEKGVSNAARKSSDAAIAKSDKAETIGDHSKAADSHREAASLWEEVSAATPAGSTQKNFADFHKDFHTKAADHHDSQASTAPIDELKKSLGSGGKFELSKLSELHHAIGLAGGACKCDKCSGLYKGDEVNEDQASDISPKIVTSPDCSKERIQTLQKLAGGFEVLQKGFDALKAENTELKADLKKLSDAPVPGGPILNTGTLEKMIGGAVAAGSPEKGPDEVQLAKAFDYIMDAANSEQKQTVSVLRSQAAMKAALVTPITY